MSEWTLVFAEPEACFDIYNQCLVRSFVHLDLTAAMAGRGGACRSVGFGGEGILGIFRAAREREIGGGRAGPYLPTTPRHA